MTYSFRELAQTLLGALGGLGGLPRIGASLFTPSLWCMCTKPLTCPQLRNQFKYRRPPKAPKAPKSSWAGLCTNACLQPLGQLPPRAPRAPGSSWALLYIRLSGLWAGHPGRATVAPLSKCLIFQSTSIVDRVSSKTLRHSQETSHGCFTTINSLRLCVRFKPIFASPGQAWGGAQFSCPKTDSQGILFPEKDNRKRRVPKKGFP